MKPSLPHFPSTELLPQHPCSRSCCAWKESVAGHRSCMPSPLCTSCRCRRPPAEATARGPSAAPPHCTSRSRRESSHHQWPGRARPRRRRPAPAETLSHSKAAPPYPLSEISPSSPSFFSLSSSLSPLQIELSERQRMRLAELGRGGAQRQAWDGGRKGRLRDENQGREEEAMGRRRCRRG